MMLALGATGAAAQTPPPGGEGASGPGAAPAPAVAPPAVAPSAPPAAPVPRPFRLLPSPRRLPPPGRPPGPAAAGHARDRPRHVGLREPARPQRSQRAGDELGRVIDVIIDKEGHPRAAIIDFGGFLGVGTRKIAVDWRALRFTSDGKERRLSVALTRNQVRVSPEYKSGEPIVVLGPASGTTPPESGDQAGANTAGQTAAPANPPVPAVPPTPAASAPAVLPPAAPPSAAASPERAQDK